jgi:hypothetical protein
VTEPESAKTLRAAIAAALRPAAQEVAMQAA